MGGAWCSIPAPHEWQNVNWTGRPWHEAVVYELHAGAMGGFTGISGQLERLADLGFTAIEIMPIADLPRAAQLGLRRRAPVRTR